MKDRSRLTLTPKVHDFHVYLVYIMFIIVQVLAS